MIMNIFDDVFSYVLGLNIVYFQYIFNNSQPRPAWTTFADVFDHCQNYKQDTLDCKAANLSRHHQIEREFHSQLLVDNLEELEKIIQLMITEKNPKLSSLTNFICIGH